MKSGPPAFAAAGGDDGVDGFWADISATAGRASTATREMRNVLEELIGSILCK
jgi:hypothetical protein